MPRTSLAVLPPGATDARHEQTGVLVKRVRARGLCTQTVVMNNVTYLKHEPETWYPTEETGQKAADAARDACRGCTVQASCLEWALRDEARFGDVHGIRGGLAADERLALIRARKATAARPW